MVLNAIQTGLNRNVVIALIFISSRNYKMDSYLFKTTKGLQVRPKLPRGAKGELQKKGSLYFLSI